MRQHAKPLAGLAYLAILALLVTFSIMAFEKALPWQGAAMVTLRTSTPGLELNPHSDVKLQGLRVGEVRSITSDGSTARIELALDPGELSLIPANVDAAIVPKTLFGEKFVDLRVPARPDSARLADGGVIQQSTTSVEIGALFSRLVPVLQALHPAELSVVLNSLAQTLDGRGVVLARTLNQLQGFLGRLDPHLAAFTHDVSAFTRTADLYAASTPDLLRLLDSAAGISKELLVPKEAQFGAFLDQIGATTDKTRQVLAENTQNLITLSGRSRPVLALLDAYSSELPCFLKGLHIADNLANHAIGALGPYTNLVIEVVDQGKPYTNPADLPSNPRSDGNNANLPFDAPSWGPHCPQFSAEVRALPNAPANSQVLQGLPINPPGTTGRVTAGAASGTAPTAAIDEARDALARTMAARSLGVPPSQVPGYADLLLAPLLVDGQVPVS